MKKQITLGIIGVLIVIVIVTIFGSMTVVDAGERAVVLKLGKVDRIMEPGLNFKKPFIENVIKTETRTQKIEAQAFAATKDLQNITTNIAIQFNLIPEEVGLLYGEVGKNYRSRIIDPAIQDITKAVTAQYTAEETITRRVDLKADITKLIKERLQDTHIFVTNVDMVNFEFAPAFSAAIEDKQVQEQKALAQVNVTKQEEEKKKQAILRAEAEAEKTRLEAMALLQNINLIDKIIAEAQLEAARSWDGVLPTHMYGSAPIPLINL